MIAPLPPKSSSAPDLAERRWKVAAYASLAVLCLSLVIISLDNTILNVALPVMVRDLHASTSQLQWIVDAYAITFAGLLLPAGSLGDRVGRKQVFLSGLLIFAAGSAASAFSTKVDELIGARALMGIGAAAIMPSTLSLLTTVFRRAPERKSAIGLWSASSGIGIAAGPIAGGWLLEHYWWGSIFLINVPMALVGALAAIWLVPGSRDPEARPSDFLGAMTSVVAMTLLLWSVIETPVRGWRSAPIVITGVAGLVAVAALVAWERRSAHPMLVLEAFDDRRFSVSMIVAGLVIFALSGALFVLTQYLQFSLGYSPLATGLRILPVAGILGVAAVVSTFLDRFVGSKVLVSSAMVVVSAGLWQLSSTSTAEGFHHALVGILLLGTGAGLALPLTTDAVVGALPPARLGVGSATNSSAIQLGGAVGVAVIGSVLASRYQGTMAPLLSGHAVPAAARAAILGSLGGALEVSRLAGGSVGLLLAKTARAAFINGMDLALKVGSVVALASAMVALLFLPSRHRNQVVPGSHPLRRASDLR